MNDRDPLRSLLHEWEAPDVSASLDTRIRAAFRTWRRPSIWERWWSLRVSVPVPALVVVMLLIAVGLWLERPTAPPQGPGQVAPATIGYMTRLETAGFQPLPDGEVRIIRSGVRK